MGDAADVPVGVCEDGDGRGLKKKEGARKEGESFPRMRVFSQSFFFFGNQRKTEVREREKKNAIRRRRRKKKHFATKYFKRGEEAAGGRGRKGETDERKKE